jgi:hypothetical protein
MAQSMRNATILVFRIEIMSLGVEIDDDVCLDEIDASRNAAFFRAAMRRDVD